MASWKTSTAILALMLLLFAIYFETETKRVIRLIIRRRVFTDREKKIPGRVHKKRELVLPKPEDLERVYKKIEDILVGGHEYAWTTPLSIDYLAQWSKRTDFAVGDSLIFKYDGKSDSVLQVSKEDYEACNTAQPIQEHKDGNTKIKLSREGSLYFISGAEGRCEKGQKVKVAVYYDFVHYWAYRRKMTEYAMSCLRNSTRSGEPFNCQIEYFGL